MYSGVGKMIVDKMRQSGFSAKQLGSGVVVWLNREVSTMEVENALQEHFPGCFFVISKIAQNQVSILEEE
jgi:hypothetical protein